jgi:hypothetical protein
LTTRRFQAEGAAGVALAYLLELALSEEEKRKS